VTKRLELARSLQRLSLDVTRPSLGGGPNAFDRRRERVSLLPCGLALTPQLGSCRVGSRPAPRHLWEFAHVASGVRFRRVMPTGSLAIDGESGIVLVLVPGGSFRMGAEPPAPGSDAQAPTSMRKPPSANAPCTRSSSRPSSFRSSR
jgi:hypothetical protein